MESPTGKLQASMEKPRSKDETREGDTKEEGHCKVSWVDREDRTTTRGAFGSLSGT
jgi:hypothetical protein